MTESTSGYRYTDFSSDSSGNIWALSDGIFPVFLHAYGKYDLNKMGNRCMRIKKNTLLWLFSAYSIDTNYFFHFILFDFP